MCGYGGSCFPKDIGALIHSGASAGFPLRILEAVKAVNEDQKVLLIKKIKQVFDQNLTNRRFAMWGLAFKPNTDDMRDAPSVTIIEGLIACGATVVGNDPAANDVARLRFGKDSRVSFSDNIYQPLNDADALIVVTEWKNFRSPDFAEIRKRMRGNELFDGRNIYDPEVVRANGLVWHGIGRLSQESVFTNEKQSERALD